MPTLFGLARKTNSSDDGIKILYKSDPNVQECLSKASVTWFENIGCLSEKYKITLKNSITNNLTPILSNKGIELNHTDPTQSNVIGWWHDDNIENGIPQNANENVPPVDDDEIENHSYYHENINNLILERAGGNRRRNIRVRVNRSTQDIPYLNRPDGLHPERSNIPMYFPFIINHLYGQGDTQEIDNLERLFCGADNRERDDVVVSVLFSPYTKLMAIVLLLNTLFLFQLVLWPTIQQLLFQ